MMHGREKSDSAIVAGKPTNKALERPGGRSGGNLGQFSSLVGVVVIARKLTYGNSVAIPAIAKTKNMRRYRKDSWLTTQSAANPSRRQFLETGKIQGIFPKNGSRGRNPRGFIVAKSAPCLTNSLLTGTGNASAPISENPGSISEAGEAFQRICCEWAFIVVRDKPDP